MSGMRSNWKVTFDPAGANELVLVEAGSDYLIEALRIPFTNKVDVSEPLDADINLFPRNQVRRDITLTVLRSHADYEAMMTFSLVHDASLPLTIKAALKVEIPGLIAVQYARCAFLNGVTAIHKREGFWTSSEYKLVAGAATILP